MPVFFSVFFLLNFKRGKPAHPLEGRLTLTNSAAVEEYIQDKSHSPKDSILPVFTEYAHLGPLSTSHRDLDPIKTLISIFDKIWEFEYDDRCTFNYVTREIRDLHNFIGRNLEKEPKLNFELLPKNSEHVESDEVGMYTVHVSQTKMSEK